MIGPVLWLRSIRERFEFRYARIGLHKTFVQKQTDPWTGRKLCQVRLCVPKGSKALRLQGLKKSQGQKNLKQMIGCSISKRLRYRIQPMSHTHKRSYKKNFLAYNWDGAAWSGKPKWDGPCKWRLLPVASPLSLSKVSRITGLRFHESRWQIKKQKQISCRKRQYQGQANCLFPMARIL